MRHGCLFIYFYLYKFFYFKNKIFLCTSILVFKFQFWLKRSHFQFFLETIFIIPRWNIKVTASPEKWLNGSENHWVARRKDAVRVGAAVSASGWRWPWPSTVWSSAWCRPLQRTVCTIAQLMGSCGRSPARYPEHNCSPLYRPWPNRPSTDLEFHQ